MLLLLLKKSRRLVTISTNSSSCRPRYPFPTAGPTTMAEDEAMYKAAADGNLDEVKRLIGEGTDVNWSVPQVVRRPVRCACGLDCVCDVAMWWYGVAGMPEA